MQREIKFRQWFMNSFHYWGFIDGGFFSPLTTAEAQGIESQQFTGLHDKNGREIYEGDIVKGGNYEGKIIDVEYEDCGFSPFAGAYFGDEIFDTELCEVIGNIYESKNLLNKLEEV